MNFIDEIKEIENDRNSKENIVVNDIIDYFKNKMEREKWKEILKENYIKKAINNGKNTCDLKIGFWEYHTGCSCTHIEVWSCGRFEIEGESGNYDSYYNYKGIRLKEIHKRVCLQISNLFKDKLKELGLKIVNCEREDGKSRFNYYEERITISW